MAEFYQEKMLVKVEVIDGENIFGGLKVCSDFQQLLHFHFDLNYSNNNQ